MKHFYLTILSLVFLAFSSCTKSQISRSQSPIFRHPAPLIVIDAGHGGKDRGASSTDKKYHEKNFTLTLAWMLKKELDEKGYRTFMTRKKDLYLSLKKRTELASQASCFISIHFNAAKNKEAEGIEIFHSDENLRKNLLAKSLATHLLRETCHISRAPSRGVKTANFYVIKNNQVPAVLIEGGFLTNLKELQKIKNPQYLHRLAYGISKGLDRYFLEQKDIKIIR